MQWSAPLAAGEIDAHISIPGSKSLTNRWLVLAALASSPTKLVGALASRDTRLMIDALTQLGANFEADVEGLIVHPIPPDSKPSNPLEIHCGLAGTVMRFVPPIAALTGAEAKFTGDAPAFVRPMAPIFDALEQQGVAVEFLNQAGYLPAIVYGLGHLPGGVVKIDAAQSSQFVSGLILAAVRAKSVLTIEHIGEELPSIPHIDMTLSLLNSLGIKTEYENHAGIHRWRVHPGQIHIGTVHIEPDLSNAGPFIAAALVAGGTVSIANWPKTTTQPGDEFRNILPLMGAKIQREQEDLEFTGTGQINGIEIDLGDVGELTPTIAALAVLANSPSHLKGIKHLRGHETDRISALSTELTKLGAKTVEHEDSLEIYPAPLQGTIFETYEDHRMATAAAIIGLKVPGVKVVNVDTTQKTLPDFVGLWMSMLHTDKPAGNTW